jgi:hypothetical protein
MSRDENLISLVYLSAATKPFSSQDLVELLTTSRMNNHKLNVSGMLLFKEGYFLQSLEGERETVMALYQKIVKDYRHRKAVVLSQASLAERDFPDWSMGFYDFSLSNPPNVAGFSDLLRSSLSLADMASDASRAKKMLLLFKEDKLLAKGHSQG